MLDVMLNFEVAYHHAPPFNLKLFFFFWHSGFVLLHRRKVKQILNPHCDYIGHD